MPGNAGHVFLEGSQMAQKGFSRGDRVSEQIRRELSELIRLEVKDPRVKWVSLTDVELTPDYAHAKVFFTTLTLGDEHEAAAVLNGLKRAAGFLRRELGKRVRIHTLPELHFHYDPSVETGNRISALIDKALESDRLIADEAGGKSDGEEGGTPSADR